MDGRNDIMISDEKILSFLVKVYSIYWKNTHLVFNVNFNAVNNCRMNEPLTSVGTGHPLEVLDRVWVLTNSVREDSHSVLKTEDEGLIISTLD